MLTKLWMVTKAFQSPSSSPFPLSARSSKNWQSGVSVKVKARSGRPRNPRYNCSYAARVAKATPPYNSKGSQIYLTQERWSTIRLHSFAYTNMICIKVASNGIHSGTLITEQRWKYEDRFLTSCAWKMGQKWHRTCYMKSPKTTIERLLVGSDKRLQTEVFKLRYLKGCILR